MRIIMHGAICSQMKQQTKEDDMARKAKRSVRLLKKDGVYVATAGGHTNRYGIGSSVPAGSCAYKPERGPWTALTLADAKQMANDFCDNMLKG